MFSIKNKIIVVTGSNGLLGQNIVKTLRKGKALVFEADINFDSSSEWNIYMDITCNFICYYNT